MYIYRAFDSYFWLCYVCVAFYVSKTIRCQLKSDGRAAYFAAKARWREAAGEDRCLRVIIQILFHKRSCYRSESIVHLRYDLQSLFMAVSLWAEEWSGIIPVVSRSLPAFCVYERLLSHLSIALRKPIETCFLRDSIATYESFWSAVCVSWSF